MIECRVACIFVLAFISIRRVVDAFHSHSYGISTLPVPTKPLYMANNPLALAEATMTMTGAAKAFLAAVTIGSSNAPPLALLSLNVGNIGAAMSAVARNPESLTCNLDNQSIEGDEVSCQQLPAVVRVRAGGVLTVQQDWGGSASTGAAVWNGANQASRYMESALKNELRGATVLELGAGVGFQSLVAQRLGATEVAVTDGDTQVLEVAQRNIEINVPEDERQQGQSIYTQRLRWGESEDEAAFLDRSRAFDFIFASDVTYLTKNHRPLLSTIAKLSDQHTRTFIALEPRTPGEVKRLLATAQEVGLEPTERRLYVDPKRSQCGFQCARMFEFKLASKTEGL